MSNRLKIILMALGLAIVWQIPYGRMMLYPLTLFATYAHEMGHGLAAVVVGAHFDKLVLYANGSGAAVWQGNPGRLATAFVAAGGLMGPTITGAGLLLLSNSDRLARRTMTILCLVMAASAVILVRNPFGMAFVLAMALAFFIIAKCLPGRGAALVLRCIAIALCLSWFNDLDYMFSSGAVVGGMGGVGSVGDVGGLGVGGAGYHSDTAVMANALFLPYWFWGAVIACVSLGVAVMGVLFSTSKKPTGKN